MGEKLEPTPEPWEIFDVRGHDRDQGLWVAHMPPDGPQTFICRMGVVPEAETNARIIAALPKMREALQPCPNPWCRSRDLARLRAHLGDSEMAGVFEEARVQCAACGLMGPTAETEDEARRLWNDRPDLIEQAVAAEREAWVDDVQYALSLKHPFHHDTDYDGGYRDGYRDAMNGAYQALFDRLKRRGLYDEKAAIRARGGEAGR